QPRVGTEVHAVPVLDLLAEVTGQRRVRRAYTDFERIEGVEIVDLIAATVRQAAVERRRHAVAIVVGRRQTNRLSDLKIAVPPPEVADVDANSWRELVLDAGRELPVVGAIAPTEPRVLVELGDGRQRPELAEVRRAFAVLRRVEHVAVRVEVASPWIANREREVIQVPCRGRADAGGVADREERQHVLPKTDLERGLAVPEQIVGGAKARRH